MKNISEDILLCDDDVKVLEKYCINKNVIELGTYKGGSARIISGVCKSILTVDTFPAFRPELEMSITFESVKSSLSDRKNIEVRKADGVLESMNHVNNKFDVIFIDDGHKYKTVMIEFLAWLPKIKKGGLFIFHDYIYKAQEEKYPNLEVREVVDDIMMSGLLIELEQSGQCYVTRKK